MTRMRLGFGLLLVALPMAGCSGPIVLPTSYHSPAIAATVVDARTQVPVGDALVVALWPLKRFEHYGLEGTSYRHSGYLKLIEVRTDAAGRFALPAWGPVRVSGQRLDAVAPQFVVVKEGYTWALAGNDRGPRYDRDLAEGGEVASKWNGGRIELQPVDDLETNVVVARLLEPLHGYPHTGDPCAWEAVPVLMAEMFRLRGRLKSDPIYGFPTPEALHQGGRCADPRQVVHFDWSTVPGPTPVRLLTPQVDAGTGSSR